MFKEGLIGFKNLHKPSHFKNNESDLDYKLIPVRVLDIILDETHPKFKQYGEWNGIGTIEFEDISNNQLIPSNNSIAVPLNSGEKAYPLVNELVLLFLLPSKDLSKVNTPQTYYYLTSINLWNHPHHNAFPDIIRHEVLKDSQIKDYESIEGNSVRRVKDNSTEINLNSPKIGGTFVEKTNIRPLLPFAGDRIYEGRFGNSLRFGNTSKTKSPLYKNIWSRNGKNGDPITILRNGQDPSIKDEGYLPTIEDINKDLSSIWLTSYQSVPIKISGIKRGQVPFGNTVGKGQTPISPSGYNKPQIIINSERILFNTTVDSILLSSIKNIILSSVKDMGLISHKNINLTGEQINLGGVNASQSIILGDNFIDNFKGLIDGLGALTKALESETSLGPSTLLAASLSNTLKIINKNMDTFLSKKTKTL